MYSNEHIKYLKKLKINSILVKITQILIFALFIIIWQILADKQMINTFIFSSPKKVLMCILNLHKTNNLYKHIWITVKETTLSFTLGTFIGLVIASIMWWFKFIAKTIDPYLTIINSLPKVALGPIIIIWAGSGMKSIIIMALLISVIVSIINIYQGFISVDDVKLKLMKALKATKYQIFIKLIIPSNTANIISTLKINISMCLIGVIMGEFLVSKAGVGYLIMYGSQVFNLDLVISGILILCIMATIMYYIVVIFEKKNKHFI